MPLAPRKERVIDLVTGGSTGLGAQLISRLLKRGHEVRALLLHQPSASIGGHEWRSLPVGTIPYVADIAQQNSSDQKVLDAACTSVNNLFHLAAATYNYNNPYDKLVNVNVVGTENILNAYKRANTGLDTHMHFLFASTVSVYGYGRPNEVLREESALKPQSPYAESKEMAEKVILSFSEAYHKIPYTIFRLGNMYGPDYKTSFFKVFKLIEEKKMVYIGGSGTNHLTFVHEEDAADAMLEAASNPKCFNKIYNLTDGVPYTVKELYNIVAKKLNVQPPRRSIPKFVGKVVRRIVQMNFDEFEFIASDRHIDISELSKDVGFKPKRSINVEGVRLIEEFERGHSKHKKVT